jgi:ABC-type glycerol-3-phosphate transport system substrate-binding protein
MSTFQTIVMGIFVALVVVGVGVFSLFGGIGGKASIGPVVIWGTIDQTAMDKVLTDLASKDKSLQDAVYIAHKPGTYQGELINAIAAGTGPDLIMLTPSTIGTLSDKISLIPYSAMSQSAYLASYIDEGQLFLTPQGLLALPFSIDPMVMYWNRDTFTGAGEASPPQSWNDFITLAPKITSVDAGGNIRQSAVALGTWDNISNAKAVLSALMMQTGDFITGRNAAGALTATLGAKPDNANAAPAAEALRFYADFANPSKTTYSWNRSLPLSYNAFASGDVAVYFGFASEYASIAARNPNLRFGVALLPQLMGTSAKITSGVIQGLAVARGARNPGGALLVAQKLTTAEAASAVAIQMGLPPVRRDVQLDTSTSAAASVFVQSALMARSWADPSAAATDGIFKVMIESVSSGKSTPEQAVYDAASAMRQLLPTQ